MGSTTYNKPDAMKLAIQKYCDITEEVNKKIVLLVSEPNTFGNCESVFSYYESTHFPLTMTILTNSWHVDRAVVIFNHYFVNRYTVINHVNAEDILKFTEKDCAEELGLDELTYHSILEKRIESEKIGIKQIEDGSYVSTK